MKDTEVVEFQALVCVDGRCKEYKCPLYPHVTIAHNRDNLCCHMSSAARYEESDLRKIMKMAIKNLEKADSIYLCRLNKKRNPEQIEKIMSYFQKTILE